MATRRTPPRGNRMPDPEETIAIGFRVPADLHEQIHARIAEEDRTMQAWLVRVVRAALAKKPSA